MGGHGARGNSPDVCMVPPTGHKEHWPTHASPEHLRGTESAKYIDKGPQAPPPRAPGPRLHLMFLGTIISETHRSDDSEVREVTASCTWMVTQNHITLFNGAPYGFDL